MTDSNPFRHHPELRGRIRPAAESSFRDMDLAEIDAHVAAAGFPADWRTPCDAREAGRRKWLEDRRDRDLWVFGYGSLMWDPSVEFDEVRQARCTGYSRSFCIWDEGGRGSMDNPGLMLAIDEGDHCVGLAFRVPREKIETETFVLFRREMLVPVYRPVWLELDTAAGPIEALSFAANRDHKDVRPGLPVPSQAAMIAQVAGILGSNFEYLSNLRDHLALLRLDDPYVSGLHAAADALRVPTA